MAEPGAGGRYRIAQNPWARAPCGTLNLLRKSRGRRRRSARRADSSKWRRRRSRRASSTRSPVIVMRSAYSRASRGTGAPREPRGRALHLREEHALAPGRHCTDLVFPGPRLHPTNRAGARRRREGLSRDPVRLPPLLERRARRRGPVLQGQRHGDARASDLEVPRARSGCARSDGCFDRGRPLRPYRLQPGRHGGSGNG